MDGPIHIEPIPSAHAANKVKVREKIQSPKEVEIYEACPGKEVYALILKIRVASDIFS